jgi:hypothetical protein
MRSDRQVEALEDFRARLREFRDSVADLNPSPELTRDNLVELTDWCDDLSRQILLSPTISEGISLMNQRKPELLHRSNSLCSRLPPPSEADFLHALSRLARPSRKKSIPTKVKIVQVSLFRLPESPELWPTFQTQW